MGGSEGWRCYYINLGVHSEYTRDIHMSLIENTHTGAVNLILICNDLVKIINYESDVLQAVLRYLNDSNILVPYQIGY